MKKKKSLSAIGIDIVDIARLERISRRWGKPFLAKVYTSRERAYARKKRYPAQHLAARFAAKEAVFKAVGGSKREFLGWKNIEILNDPDGKPVVCWHGRAEALRKKRGWKNALVSLSHTDHYAAATAMLVS